MGPTSIPSPVKDCRMPFIRASFCSGKTIITILHASITAMKDKQVSWLDEIARKGSQEIAFRKLTGAIEAAKAETFKETAKKRANCIGDWVLNEVKDAENQHREALTDASDYKHAFRPVRVQQIRKHWRKNGHRNRVCREDNSMDRCRNTFFQRLLWIKRCDRGIRTVGEQIDQAKTSQHCDRIVRELLLLRVALSFHSAFLSTKLFVVWYTNATFFPAFLIF